MTGEEGGTFLLAHVGADSFAFLSQTSAASLSLMNDLIVFMLEAAARVSVLNTTLGQTCVSFVRWSSNLVISLCSLIFLSILGSFLGEKLSVTHWSL